MQANIRLSIIIPFYNVEQYIAQCLDSVYNQDIPEEEYEVICVNDASPDNARDIVLEYQKKHPNLILVEHEINKKLGAARNTGRGVARGKYIWNVDSDDMIAPNCLREMLAVCDKQNLDVLLFQHQDLREDTTLTEAKVIWNENYGVVDGFTFWKTQGIRNKTFISPVWLMVLRREYLDENKIYSPAINMNEDIPYTYQCITLAQHIIATNNSYYITRLNSTSLTAEFKKKVSLERLFEDMFLSAIDLYTLYNHIPQSEKIIKKVIKDVVIYEFIVDAEILKRLDKKQVCQYASLLRRNLKPVIILLYLLPNKQKWQLMKLFFTV